MYVAKSCLMLPRSNNFVVTSATGRTANYWISFITSTLHLQALPQALARLGTNGMALQGIQCFIVDYIRHSDNFMNRYADNHNRGSLLNALAACVAPVSTLGGGNCIPDALR
ncbi:unnamed protein product [Strongylus vulgaris]|uniref:Transcription initiation factor TFIID subunit 2 TPR repeats domain-containing protein n=1 Tax=Strongylus vulgaris TaxID=40348 RepID=A0A3P7ILE7_STRVU|nr:unnamed protein product [Strongylus vulgaris]